MDRHDGLPPPCLPTVPRVRRRQRAVTAAARCWRATPLSLHYCCTLPPTRASSTLFWRRVLNSGVLNRATLPPAAHCGCWLLFPATVRRQFICSSVLNSGSYWTGLGSPAARTRTTRRARAPALPRDAPCCWLFATLICAHGTTHRLFAYQPASNVLFSWHDAARTFAAFPITITNRLPPLCQRGDMRAVPALPATPVVLPAVFDATPRSAHTPPAAYLPQRTCTSSVVDDRDVKGA